MGTVMVPRASRTPSAPKIRIIVSGISSVQIATSMRTPTVTIISVVAHWHSDTNIFVGVAISINKVWLVAKAITPTDARVFRNASPSMTFPLHITSSTIGNNARDAEMPTHVRYV